MFNTRFKYAGLILLLVLILVSIIYVNIYFNKIKNGEQITQSLNTYYKAISITTVVCLSLVLLIISDRIVNDYKPRKNLLLFSIVQILLIFYSYLLIQHERQKTPINEALMIAININYSVIGIISLSILYIIYCLIKAD